MLTDIYQAMVNARVAIDNHESDLYVPVNAITQALMQQYKFKSIVSIFMNQVTHTPYYDIPFAYNPYWEKRMRRS